MLFCSLSLSPLFSRPERALVISDWWSLYLCILDIFFSQIKSFIRFCLNPTQVKCRFLISSILRMILDLFELLQFCLSEHLGLCTYGISGFRTSRFWTCGHDFLGFWALGLLWFWTSGLSDFWALGKFEDNFTKYWCGAWGQYRS